jgi:pyruvate dehydrogenase E1 component alpha subunit
VSGHEDPLQRVSTVAGRALIAPAPPPRSGHALSSAAVAEESTRTAQPEIAGDGRQATAVALPDPDTCRELLETMALIRRFEEEAGRQYQRAKAGGFLHLAIGEEATIVGTTSVMRDDDYLIGSYRTHGHGIARGTDPKHVMAELFGREDGTSRGRGGSMHIFDAERRFMGGYGIVGGNLPLAAGLALASDYRGTDEVTVCMFGDGASNAGNFGETMNLAALWRLPVVFILENNLYGMGTSVERHSAVTDFSKKAEGLGVPGVRCDGMDVLAVRETVTEHIRIAREDRRPTLVEAFTYRYRGHSAADPEVYRTKEEVEEWRQKDPVKTFRDRLLAEDVISEAEVEDMRERIEQRVVGAVEFADNSPEPPLESLYENLYVLGDQIPGWYAVDERTPQPHRGEEEHEVGAGGEVKELAEAGAAYAGQAASTGRRPGQDTEDRNEGDAGEEEADGEPAEEDGD